MIKAPALSINEVELNKANVAKEFSSVYGGGGGGGGSLAARERVPGYRHKMVLFSHLEYPICDCVHSCSISPRHKKQEPSNEYKTVDWCLRTNKNNVHTGTHNVEKN